MNGKKFKNLSYNKAMQHAYKKKEYRHINFYPEEEGEEEKDASKLTKYVCWTLNNSYTQAHIFIKSQS